MIKKLAGALLAALLTFSAAPLPAAAQPDEHASPRPINDWSCVPATTHPHPIVFIHGTSANAYHWQDATDYFRGQGYCTFALNYGSARRLPGRDGPAYALNNIEDSALEIQDFIDQVREYTGADKVVLVGHSQGGLHTKYQVSKLGNAHKVARVVSLGGTIHGTTFQDSVPLFDWLIERLPRLAELLRDTAAPQQLVGSLLIDDLDRYPDTVDGVTYTALYSPHDTTVTPNTNSMFFSDDPTVANVDVVAACNPGREVTHGPMASDPLMISLTHWALERDPAQTSPAPADCVRAAG